MNRRLRQCGVIHRAYPKGATCLDVREAARGDPGHYGEEFLHELLSTNIHLCDACLLQHILSGEEPQYPASQDDSLGRVAGLQAIVKTHGWRDAAQVDPADGDEFLVAVRISGDRTKWWEFEVVTVQISENYFCLEVDGDTRDYEWKDIAWCVPMSAMQPPEAAEAAGE